MTKYLYYFSTLMVIFHMVTTFLAYIDDANNLTFYAQVLCVGIWTCSFLIWRNNAILEKEIKDMDEYIEELKEGIREQELL